MAHEPIRFRHRRPDRAPARRLDVGRRAVAAGPLLAEAAAALVAARVLLRCRSLGRAQAALARVGARWARRRPGAAPARIAWAVAVAGRLFPGARCLPRALAIHAVLQRHGHPARLRLGFLRADAALLGHAWVEVDGRVLGGGGAGQGWSALEPPPAAAELSRS